LYGVGAFGYGSIGQTTSSFLMFFGTGVLGIPGTLMGIAIGISTVWDATTDPIVGHLSDNTKSRRFGKRHGWILFAGIAVAVANLLLWSIPSGLGINAKFWLLFIMLLLMETFNTCYSTPYSALGLDLSRSYDDRTAVQNFRAAFSFSSLLVPSLLMLVFLRDPSLPGGYMGIAWVTSTLCILCAVICFIGTRRALSSDDFLESPKPSDSARAKKGGLSSIFGEFFGVMKQKNVALLIFGYAVSLSAGAFITSLGLHVFTYTFGFSTTQIPIIMVSLIVGIVGGQPFWYRFSKRTDKKTALLTALGLLCVCMVVFSALLAFREVIPIGALMFYICSTIFLSGVGSGCLYSIPISMYADCVDKRRTETGIDNAGKSAGFLTFCTKISNALILFIIGLSLDIIGFNGANATQPYNVQNWLGIVLVTGVVTASVIAMLIYSRYDFKKEDFN